jgi:hypothetical protein
LAQDRLCSSQQHSMDGRESRDYLDMRGYKNGGSGCRAKHLLYSASEAGLSRSYQGCAEDDASNSPMSSASHVDQTCLVPTGSIDQAHDTDLHGFQVDTLSQSSLTASPSEYPGSSPVLNDAPSSECSTVASTFTALGKYKQSSFPRLFRPFPFSCRGRCVKSQHCHASIALTAS